MLNLSRSRRVIDLRKWRAKDVAPARARAARAELSQNRKSSLRVRRRKLRALAVFILALLFAVTVGVLSWVSYLPQFSISTISVNGTKEIPEQLVRTYIESRLYDGSYTLFSRNNIFLYPRVTIEKSIVSYFPRISTANISRNSLLAQAITVTVAERQPFALWCSIGEVCYLMDADGFIFAPASTSTAGALMVFRGDVSPQAELSPGKVANAADSPIGQTFLSGRFGSVIELFKRLRLAGYAPTGATVLNEKDFSISFSDGFALHISFGSDASTLVRNLQLALSADPLLGKVDKLDYIDMRFGDRVYYKFKK